MNVKNQYVKTDGFFMLPNDIFKLNLDSYSFMIYSYLVSCAGEKGECWPSIPTIGRTLNISISTVQSRLKILEDKKFIVKENKSGYANNGKPHTFNNHYHIEKFEKAWNQSLFKHLEMQEKSKLRNVDEIEI